MQSSSTDVGLAKVELSAEIQQRHCGSVVQIQQLYSRQRHVLCCGQKKLNTKERAQV